MSIKPWFRGVALGMALGLPLVAGCGMNEAEDKPGTGIGTDVDGINPDDGPVSTSEGGGTITELPGEDLTPGNEALTPRPVPEAPSGDEGATPPGDAEASRSPGR